MISARSADQPLDLLGAVADGEVGQDVADIAELDLDVVLVPQDVVDLDAGKADVQRVDAELGGVKVKDRVAVAQFLAKGVVAAHGVDLFPGVLGHIRHLMEHLPPPQGKVAAGDVQTGHEQIAAGGGLGQVDDLPHIARVHIGPMSSRLDCVKLPPLLCMETDAISAPAAMADTGRPPPK